MSGDGSQRRDSKEGRAAQWIEELRAFESKGAGKQNRQVQAGAIGYAYAYVGGVWAPAGWRCLNAVHRPQSGGSAAGKNGRRKNTGQQQQSTGYHRRSRPQGIRHNTTQRRGLREGRVRAACNDACRLPTACWQHCEVSRSGKTAKLRLPGWLARLARCQLAKRQGSMMVWGAEGGEPKGANCLPGALQASMQLLPSAQQHRLGGANLLRL